jgi:hypothetical protein
MDEALPDFESAKPILLLLMQQPKIAASQFSGSHRPSDPAVYPFEKDWVILKTKPRIQKFCAGSFENCAAAFGMLIHWSVIQPIPPR